MTIPLLHAFAPVVLFWAITTEASAVESTAKSHPCATVSEPAERLGCYDKAFPPAADTRSLAGDLQSEKDRALSQFGLNKLQLRDREPERMRDVMPDRIEATVAGMRYLATGERVVTLDNDQMWLLTEVTSKGRLESGERVAIREAAMGTYMLVTPRRIALRARRLR